MDIAIVGTTVEFPWSTGRHWPSLGEYYLHILSFTFLYFYSHSFFLSIHILFDLNEQKTKVIPIKITITKFRMKHLICFSRIKHVVQPLAYDGHLINIYCIIGRSNIRMLLQTSLVHFIILCLQWKQNPTLEFII